MTNENIYFFVIVFTVLISILLFNNISYIYGIAEQKHNATLAFGTVIDQLELNKAKWKEDILKTVIMKWILM